MLLMRDGPDFLGRLFYGALPEGERLRVPRTVGKYKDLIKNDGGIVFLDGIYYNSACACGKGNPCR